MKADEIVDDAMIRTAHEAYDAPGIWGRDEAMRAALLAVVPLFAERFAKIADALADSYDRDIKAGIGKIDPETERKLREQGFGIRDASAAIRAAVKDRSPETQKPAATPKGITAAE